MMTDNPYSTDDESLSPVSLSMPAIFRVLPTLACWLIALGFLAHGLLLAGEYFANNATEAPSQTGKTILVAVIVAPIAVACLAFITGCTWISRNKHALEWTVLTAVLIVVYVAYFLWLLL